MILESALFCLALNIYHEARNQDDLGQVAVAEVVLNRVEDPRFPDNVCDVVKQRRQFSWYWDGKPDRPRNKYAWARAVSNAQAARGDGDITNGALFYHAPYVYPHWAPAFKQTHMDAGHLYYKDTP